MRKALVIACAFGVIGACGRARFDAPTYPDEEPQAAPAPQAPASARRLPPARAVARSPFLWQVQTDPPSYLFGTIHMGVSLDEALPAGYQAALESARVVIQEQDPDAVQLDAIAETATLPRRRRLADYLTPLAWNRISNELLGVVDSVRLRTLRPWVPMVFLTRERARDIRRTHQGPSMDAELNTYAQQLELSLRYLETAEQQAEALGAIPDEEMGQIVSDLVLEPQRLNDELDALIQAYLDASSDRISGILFETNDPSMRAFNRAMFAGRNEQWMEALEAELQQGGVFVAVGLGHLLGEEGLIERLRAMGYTLARAG